MKIVLSHESAYEYIINHPEISYQARDDGARCLPFETDRRGISKFDFERYGLSGPVHVIMSPDQRFQSDKFVCHACKQSLPPGSIIKIDNEVSVCCPELTLIQLAEEGSVGLIAKAICELCGTYLSDEPITRIERIASYLNKVSRMRGIKTVRSALKYCLNDSRSPMETVLMLLLCLPTHCGGYGIPSPEFNVRVDFNSMAEKISGKRYCVCDLLWKEAKLDVEYDSDLFHTGSERIANDSKRRMALKSMGYETIAVTRGQIKDRAAFHEVAKMIARCLSFRIRTTRTDFDTLQISLREVLFQDTIRHRS